MKKGAFLSLHWPKCLAFLAVLGWGIMHHVGIVEMGVIAVFIVAVALAVWWVVVRLRG